MDHASSSLRQGAAAPAAADDGMRVAVVERYVAAGMQARAGLDRLAGAAAQALRAPLGLVTLVGGDEQLLAGAAGVPAPLAGERRTPLEHSLCRHVVAAGEALAVGDVQRHPSLSREPAAATWGAAAYLGAPLTAPSGHTLGALCAIDVQPRIWSPGDLALVEALAASAMTELELHVARESIARAESLAAGHQRVLELIGDGAPLGRALEELARGLETQMREIRCSILLLEAGRAGRPPRLRHASAPSLSPEYCKAIDGLEIGPAAGTCGAAAFLNRPVITADVLAEPNWKGFRRLALATGIRACWSAPIASRRGRVLGTLAMYHTLPRVPTADDRAVLDQASRLACVAIEQARDRLRLRRSLARSRALAVERSALERLARTVAEGAEPASVLEMAARESGRLLRADGAAVLRAAGAGTEALAGWSADPLRRPPSGIALGEGRLRPASPGRGTAPDGTQVVAAPIVVASRTWGTMIAVRAGGSRAFVRDDERHLVRFAEVVATSVVSATWREQLAAEAATDPLTGLANRRAFKGRLDEEVRRARRHRRELAVVLLDLDNLKPVNDGHGHAAGDAILRAVAGCLRAVKRSHELAARLGGDEFALLLPDTAAEQACAAAERVRAAVGGIPAAARLGVSVSAGVATLGTAETAAALVELADAALYEAKRAGRDRVALAAYAERAASAGRAAR